MEEKKKKNTGLIVLVVMLLLGFIVTSGYIVYDKVLSSKKESIESKPEQDENEKEKIQILDISSKEVVDLFNTLTSSRNAYCGVNDYYTDKEVNASQISNSLVFDIAVTQLSKDRIKQGIARPFQKAGDGFMASELESKISTIFGKKYQFTHQNSEGCPSFNYDATTKKYTMPADSACGGTCGSTTLKMVVKATKTDKAIDLYVRVLFNGKSDEQALNYYKDYSRTQLVEGLELDNNGSFAAENINNISKGSLYQMTFNHEDGNYVFVSSKLVFE